MGVGGCSIGVKRLPEVGDDGGNRDGDVFFAKRFLPFFFFPVYEIYGLFGYL